MTPALAARQVGRSFRAWMAENASLIEAARAKPAVCWLADRALPAIEDDGADWVGRQGSELAAYAKQAAAFAQVQPSGLPAYDTRVVELARKAAEDWSVLADKMGGHRPRQGSGSISRHFRICRSAYPKSSVIVAVSSKRGVRRRGRRSDVLSVLPYAAHTPCHANGLIDNIATNVLDSAGRAPAPACPGDPGAGLASRRRSDLHRDDRINQRGDTCRGLHGHRRPRRQGRARAPVEGGGGGGGAGRSAVSPRRSHPVGARGRRDHGCVLRCCTQAADLLQSCHFRPKKCDMLWNTSRRPAKSN